MINKKYELLKEDTKVSLDGETRGMVSRVRDKRQTLRSAYYLMGSINPGVTKDLIEYELDKLDLFKDKV